MQWGTQAQAEDCWQIYSHWEVCSEESQEVHWTGQSTNTACPGEFIFYVNLTLTLPALVSLSSMLQHVTCTCCIKMSSFFRDRSSIWCMNLLCAEAVVDNVCDICWNVKYLLRIVSLNWEVVIRDTWYIFLQCNWCTVGFKMLFCLEIERLLFNIIQCNCMSAILLTGMFCVLLRRWSMCGMASPSLARRRNWSLLCWRS